jgi:hypothetical protein
MARCRSSLLRDLQVVYSTNSRTVPFRSDVEMPIVGGSGPFQGAVGTIAVSIADLLDEDDGCDVGW